MTRPIVIVDPVSSGAELAPAFAARGIPTLAVRSAAIAASTDARYARGIQPADFGEIYEDTPDLVERLRRVNPQAVIPGFESGVVLADQLAVALTPQFANDPALSKARRHKAEMQSALAKAGLPAIRTINTASAGEVRDWLASHGLTSAALVVKPPASMGSNNVYHVPPGGDWQRPFDHILSTPTAPLNERSETAVVQEMVIGTEYCVDTVSAAGKHALAHLIKYSKTSAGDRMTVFDHTEFVEFDRDRYGELVDYAERVLDALGIQWGAAHSEIMVTANGPRLIETGARMCGGPVLGFSRAATGSSQLERVIEAYVDGEIRTPAYSLKRTVVPVFLAAPVAGTIRNIEILDELRGLATHLKTVTWLKNGDRVRRTVDFLSAIGIVALAGERDAVFADYARVRKVEARLTIEP
jgi:biotin carboxylase